MTDDKKMEKLVNKAIHGNAKAYGKLIEYYKDYLYRTAMLSSKNQEKALDIVSECILNGFRSIHTLKKPGYFKTWITRILMNGAIDYYRDNPSNENIDDINVVAPDKMISSEEKMDLYRAIVRLYM